MAIETRACFSRLARIGVGLLIGVLSVCGSAGAQAPPPVTTGSLVPIPVQPGDSAAYSGSTQLAKILFYDGQVLALDTGVNALYQLTPGASSWEIISPAGGVLGPVGGFTAEDIALDAQGTLYITRRYGPTTITPTGSVFLRVPYNKATQTWDISSGDGWGSNVVDSDGNAISWTDSLVFVDDSPTSAKYIPGNGTLYWMSENGDIFKLHVNNSDGQGGGTQAVLQATNLVSGLTVAGGYIAVDVNGNIYLMEDHYNTARVSGIYFIPAGASGIVTPPSAESQLQRIDSASNTISYAGVTLDTKGNLYLTSEDSSGGDETFAGTWVIPNECGSPAPDPAAVHSASCLNWNHISLLDTIPAGHPLSIDSRGYLWIPTYQAPPLDGSAALPNVWGLVVWAPGSLNVPASAAGTGTPGPAGTIYATFNESVTLGATNPIQFVQTGGGSDFSAINTDPNPAAPPATIQCTAATTYAAQTSCEYWVGLNPHAPGPISGQLLIAGADANNKPVQSISYLHGIGQGPEVAMLSTPTQSTIASATSAGLVSPAQVASDPLGNTYVADPGSKSVLKFLAGSSSAAGTQVAGSWTAPTGVAVDGSGDVYVADSKNVFEISAVNGSIAGQTPVKISAGLGLGTPLNLAVDGVGDVYVADPQNARVVKIPNPAAAYYNPIYSPTAIAVGSGFTAPSAVAVDSFGNVFVADGANLSEVTPWAAGAGGSLVLSGSATIPIYTSLSTSTPVSGLAVDASGSVIVSQAGGLLRIPSVGGTFNTNGVSALASAIAAPNGVALDQAGNIYVIDTTPNTQSPPPNLFELAVSGSINFGDALTPTVQTEADADLFNIGNLPLQVLGPPAFSGPDATPPNSDFAAAASAGPACDVTDAKNLVPTGSSCALGLGFTPPAPPVGDNNPITYSGDTMTATTNASNVAGGSITASLSGTALANLETTSTAVNLASATSTYPGTLTATVVITPVPDPTLPPNNHVPTGPVTLTLTNTVSGTTMQPPVQQATANSDGTATATFTLSNLQAGSFTVSAAYGGNVPALFKTSASSAATFSVAQATPVVTLSEPLGVVANTTNGVYYVPLGKTSITLASNVSAAAGTPTGSVTFTNGAPLPSGSVVATSPMNANGNASFNTGALAVGSYSIFANYSGDQNFLQFASPVVTFQVIQPVALITSSPAALSTPAGTPVGATITIQSLAKFSATNGANIVCDNSTLPYYSECTFSNPLPIICAPTGLAGDTCTGITTTDLTVTSNIPVNLPPSTTASAKSHGSGGSPLIPAGIFGLGIFGLALRRRGIFNRKLLNGSALSFMLIGAVMGFGGCTNSSYTKTPPPLQYKTASGIYSVNICLPDQASHGYNSAQPCAVTANYTPLSLPFTLPVTIK